MTAAGYGLRVARSDWGSGADVGVVPGFGIMPAEEAAAVWLGRSQGVAGLALISAVTGQKQSETALAAR